MAEEVDVPWPPGSLRRQTGQRKFRHAASEVLQRMAAPGLMPGCLRRWNGRGLLMAACECKRSSFFFSEESVQTSKHHAA